MIRVPLEDPGDSVLIRHPTGVTYELQVGGHGCVQVEAEGFIAPVEPRAAVEALDRWWEAEFGSHDAFGGDWTSARLSRLRDLVGALSARFSNRDGVVRVQALELDEERLCECHEAWIPVRTVDGAGWLLRPNSD